MHDIVIVMHVYDMMHNMLLTLVVVVFILLSRSFLLIDSHNPIPGLPVEVLFRSSTTLRRDEIIIQSVVDDLKSTSTDKPGIGFWESISKKLQQSKPD